MTLTWSYGGGTQSVAIAVLIAQGKLPVPELIVIADTGREATETWEYMEAHVQPLLATVGAKVEVASRSLAKLDLYAKNGDLLVPTFTASGKLPTFCSDHWKKRVVRRWLRERGVTRCETWIGISIDEIGRAKPSDVKWQRYTYPLLFDVPLRRHDCREIVMRAGLPEPPKSSCWMCPHRRNAQWRRLRDHYPADFDKAKALDVELRAQDSQGGVFLHDSRLPLAEANIDAEDAPISGLFGELGDGCDSGFCFV